MARAYRAGGEDRASARGYASYGNVAYQPKYDGDAARAPERRQPEPRQRPRILPRERVARRPVVEVRRQSPISLFALAGFMAVAASVFLMLTCAIQLAVVADQTFDLQDELSDLQNEEKKLLAQYELAYDLSAIEREMTASGAMVRASAGDTVYLDLAEADSVTYYHGAASGISGLVDRLEDAIRGLFSKTS